VNCKFFSTKLTGEIDMLSKAKALFSSLVAGVIILAMLFFIVPWLLLVLAVVGIAVLASVLLGRGRINITTVRITNTQHGNLIQTVKTMSSTMEYEAGRNAALRERIADTDIITIHPDGSVSEAAPEEDSFKPIKGT
jgi:hypothetical protein